MDGRDVAVSEDAVDVTPFGTLAALPEGRRAATQPRVLLVAPMSGHFATLLRGTVRTMLPDHDVYMTDWHNARDVPLAAGRFGFDDYVEHLIRFLEAIGPGRPRRRGVPALRRRARRRAVMAQGRHPAQPRSMTLMAGPDRHPRQSDQGERARDEQADRVVRAQPDRHRAAALSAAPMRRVYPGLPAARRLHVHEPRPPREGAPSTCYGYLVDGRARQGARRPRRSTTSTSR